MADYRAKNRNTKAVDVARIRAAAKFSTPAPKVNPNVVDQKPKVSAKYSTALREMAQRGVAGARGGSYFNRSQYGIEGIFDPVAGVSGAAGLVTTDYNPEGIDYGQRTVPTIRGGMVSGGGPGIGSSFAGIGAALYGATTATPITEFNKKRYEKNPFSIRGSNLGLSPEQKREQANDQTAANRKKDYSDLLRTLKAAGLTEEELYRDAVVSPDGRINLNPNAQAAISQLGNAADSLRLLDVVGLGLGKPVAMGASFAGKQAVKQVSRGLDSLIPRVGRVASDIAMAPAGIVLGAGAGGAGGNILRAARESAANLKPIVDAPRSSLLPSGEKQAVDRVIAARETENFIKNTPTPEASSPAYFGGIETRNLSPEAIDERVSGAAEYISPEELAEELSTLEGMGFATADKTPASAKSAVSLTQKELADRTAAALAGIKKRENAVNIKRESKGQDPFKYETHFDPYDLTKEELVTLWGSNPIYVYNAAGEIIPELGAHLGHGPGRALANGGSATLGAVRGQRGIANMRYGSDF